MGHKVHPTGFRLGIIKDWQSKWYSDTQYAEFVYEDTKLRNAIRAKYPEAAISLMEIDRQAKDVTITLYTARPGIVIGRGGQRVDEMRLYLEDLVGKKIRLNIQEVRQPEMDAYLVARSVAEQIERRIAYRRAMKQAIFRTIQAGAKGIKVSCAGRLGNAEIARRQTSHQGQVPLHYRVTTKRNKAHLVAPNLLKRDFLAARPDQKWLADITYIPTRDGWLYLAVILDLYARRVVGWAMSDRVTSDLTVGALKMAIDQREPRPGLIHHSDQGSQYTDSTYRQLLQDHAIEASMNSTGNWYDNAPMESFFGTLKSELVHYRRYGTHGDARADLFFYIESFYNRRRLHSTLGYLSPEAYEQLYCNDAAFA